MTDFRGVQAAAVTPRGKQGDIDLGAAFDLIDHLCAGGVDGIALFTEWGEYPAFTNAERTRLVYLAAKRSRVPVLAGIGSSTLDQSVELAREARDGGAAALLLPPPFFFRYDGEELVEFYRRFAQASGCGGETFVCNTPEWTSPIPVEALVELLGAGFAGVQESSGNPDTLDRLQAAVAGPQVSLLVGSDDLFTRGRCGRRAGAVSAAACALPEEFLDWERQFPRPTLIKEAAGLRGLKTGPVSIPFSPAKARRLDEFREWFKGWLPAIKKMSAHV